jgi:tellurite resistance protein
MDPSKTDAALAGAAALLAAAAGADPEPVRARLEGSGPQVVEAFDQYLEHFSGDADTAETAAFQVLHPVKSDVEAASRIMDAVLSAGGGANELAPVQVAAARRICETLNLSPTRFGL